MWNLNAYQRYRKCRLRLKICYYPLNEVCTTKEKERVDEYNLRNSLSIATENKVITIFYYQNPTRVLFCIKQC